MNRDARECTFVIRTLSLSLSHSLSLSLSLFSWILLNLSLTHFLSLSLSVQLDFVESLSGQPKDGGERTNNIKKETCT